MRQYTSIMLTDDNMKWLKATHPIIVIIQLYGDTTDRVCVHIGFSHQKHLTK